MRCDKPPDGWWCSRKPGHEGPCAARVDFNQSYRTKNRVELHKDNQLIAKFMDEPCGEFVIYEKDGYKYYGELKNEVGGTTYIYAWVMCQNYQPVGRNGAAWLLTVASVLVVAWLFGYLIQIGWR